MSVHSDEPVLSFRNASLGYGNKVVLEDLSVEIRKGDFVGVIGSNGSGKTTLLRAILGLVRPSAGSVTVRRGLRYGYVAQRQYVDTLFPFRVIDVVRMGRAGQTRPWSRLRPKDEMIIEESLEVAGIAGLKAILYRDLSGGQKQRVLIARALAADPDILLLDEPTNDMDVKGEHQVLELFQELRRKKHATIILVSHLLHVVLNYADTIVFLAGGTAHVHALEEIVRDDLLSKIYDVPVRIGRSGKKRYVVAGDGE